MGERSASQLDRDLSRLAGGDRSAFSPVFAALWPIVRRFCRGALGQEADGDDAAQVALQKLFYQAGRYDGETPAIAWALTIAAWECRTLRRQRQRSRAIPLEQARDLSGAAESPEAQLLQRDLEAAVHSVVAQLAEPDQAAIRAALRGVEASSSARDRKRKQRALVRLRETFRRIYGT